jgi:phosphatidylinositol 4-phosphatase
VEERARVVLNTLASRSESSARPVYTSTPTIDTIHEEETSPFDSRDEEEVDNTKSSSPRVQFSTSDDVKILTPTITEPPPLDNQDALRPRSPSPAPSDASFEVTPATSVAKAVASRLSFWNTMLKPLTPAPSNPASQPPVTENTKEPIDLDTAIQEGSEPSAVLGEILGSGAEPATVQEKHNEMEDKIVRECVREFTKGGMYFAYNFGGPHSYSMQRSSHQVSGIKISPVPCNTSRTKWTNQGSNMHC